MALAVRTLDRSTAADDLLVRGYHAFPRPFDPNAAGRLLTALRRDRTFDGRLFLTEAEFDAAPQYVGVNPTTGRNLLERFEDDLAFVERDLALIATLTDLLGEGYQLLNKKVVCGVPAKWVPDWLKRRIAGNPVNNLGAYIRPEYRDVTYFYGIDFHQDLIDFKGRDADFLTLYVYLHDVGPQDAPLFLLERSHRFGATVFPHDLTQTESGWLYRDSLGRVLLTRQKMLTGGAGQAAIWHGCTLHGTQPHGSDNERLSLRYLFAQSPTVLAGLDRINANLEGPVRLAATRSDLDSAGAARMKANNVNRA